MDRAARPPLLQGHAPSGPRFLSVLVPAALTVPPPGVPGGASETRENLESEAQGSGVGLSQPRDPSLRPPPPLAPAVLV